MSRSRRFIYPLFLLAVALAIAFSAPAAELSKELRKTIPLGPDGRVEIETYKGSVEVAAEERADVVVEARVVPDRGCGDEKAWAEWVDRTEVRVDAGPNSVRVRSDYGALESYQRGFLSRCTSRPFVEYRIRMPRTASLAIKDYKSKIDVGPLAAPLRLESYKGTMRVHDLAGRLDLETYKGDARVEFARFGGDSHVETYKGGIELYLPKGSAFTLDAVADRRGRIRSDFEPPSRVVSGRRSREQLSGSVNGGGPRLEASTHKGTIRLVAR